MSAEKFQLLNTWARHTIMQWQVAIIQAKIGDSDELLMSFDNHIQTTAGGDFEKITFIYKYYGAMSDMGVGKGTKIGDVGSYKESRRLEGKQIGNRRRAKKWHNEVINRRTGFLAHLIAEHYGNTVLLDILDRNELGQLNTTVKLSL